MRQAPTQPIGLQHPMSCHFLELIASLQKNEHFSFKDANYIKIIMSLSQVSSLMAERGVTLEPALLNQIVHSLNAQPPPLADNQERKLHVIAAAAVRAELELVPSVSGQGKVRYGLTFQQFLRHTPKDEKSQFLQAVEQVLAGSKQAPANLLAKFGELKRTYAIFLHFQAVFNELAQRVAVSCEVTGSLMSTFWIVFLHAKSAFNQRCKEYGQPAELEILHTLLHFAFEKIGHSIQLAQITSSFSREFGESALPSKQLTDQYIKQFKKILNEAYHIRYDNDSQMDIKVLASNECLLIRFVDDFSSKFSQRNGHQTDEINELNYLQLDKSITPQSLAKTMLTEHQIDTVLNYATYEEASEPQFHIDGEENGSPPTRQENGEHNSQEEDGTDIFRRFLVVEEEGYGQMQKRRKKFVVNKCQTRISILKWVQDQIRQAEGKAIDNLLAEIGETVDMGHYEQVSFAKIMNILELVCSSCKDKPHRASQIYSLFLAFLQKMRKGMKQEDFINISGNPSYLDAFLSLTTIIFNYAYKTLELSFQEYCLRFDVSISTGFVPLNWLGVNGDLPKELQLFLFELEERILFEELWKSESASNLFSSSKTVCSFVEMAMKKRLLKHLNHRIVQLCRNDITDKEKGSLFRFIEDALATKVHLLRESNLYVILACSIIYLYGKNIPLHKILQALRKNDSIVRITLQANDHGLPISVEEFYKTVFLHEMEPIITARKEVLYCTPIKSTPITAIRHTAATEQKSPAITHKYRFGEDSLAKESNKSYRQRLARKIFMAPCQIYPKNSSSDEEIEGEEDV